MLDLMERDRGESSCSSRPLPTERGLQIPSRGTQGWRGSFKAGASRVVGLGGARREVGARSDARWPSPAWSLP